MQKKRKQSYAVQRKQEERKENIKIMNLKTIKHWKGSQTKPNALLSVPNIFNQMQHNRMLNIAHYISRTI
jgi:hypothetical protein